MSASFATSEGLRAVLERLHDRGARLLGWRHDPEAERLMQFTIRKYRALALKHHCEPEDRRTQPSRRCGHVRRQVRRRPVGGRHPGGQGQPDRRGARSWLLCSSTRRGAARSSATTTHAASATTRPASSNSLPRAAALAVDAAAAPPPLKPGETPPTKAFEALNLAISMFTALGWPRDSATCALDYIAARLIESGDRHEAHASCGGTTPAGPRSTSTRRPGRRCCASCSATPTRPRPHAGRRRRPRHAGLRLEGRRTARRRPARRRDQRRRPEGRQEAMPDTRPHRTRPSDRLDHRRRPSPQGPRRPERAHGVDRGGRPAPAGHHHSRRRARLRVAATGGRAPARLAHDEGLGPLRHLRQALAPARPAGREPTPQAAHELEKAALYRELKVLEKEEAERRMQRPSSAGQARWRSLRLAPVAGAGGDPRTRAAAAWRHRQATYITTRVARSWIGPPEAETPSDPCAIAANMLSEIEHGAPVSPAYKRSRQPSTGQQAAPARRRRAGRARPARPRSAQARPGGGERQGLRALRNKERAPLPQPARST